MVARSSDGELQYTHYYTTKAEDVSEKNKQVKRLAAIAVPPIVMPGKYERDNEEGFQDAEANTHIHQGLT